MLNNLLDLLSTYFLGWKLDKCVELSSGIGLKNILSNGYFSIICYNFTFL